MNRSCVRSYVNDVANKNEKIDDIAPFIYEVQSVRSRRINQQQEYGRWQEATGLQRAEPIEGEGDHAWNDTWLKEYYGHPEPNMSVARERIDGQLSEGHGISQHYRCVESYDHGPPLMHTHVNLWLTYWLIKASMRAIYCVVNFVSYLFLHYNFSVLKGRRQEVIVLCNCGFCGLMLVATSQNVLGQAFGYEPADNVFVMCMMAELAMLGCVGTFARLRFVDGLLLYAVYASSLYWLWRASGSTMYTGVCYTLFCLLGFLLVVSNYTNEHFFRRVFIHLRRQADQVERDGVEEEEYGIRREMDKLGRQFMRVNEAEKAAAAHLIADSSAELARTVAARAGAVLAMESSGKSSYTPAWKKKLADEGVELPTLEETLRMQEDLIMQARSSSIETAARSRQKMSTGPPA